MTDNDNLELKKRSRRRLVGAAALALLAAIVLPMVMDQEPGTPTQDIQITIPDRDADSALARPIGAGAAVVSDPQITPVPEEQASPPDDESEVAGPAAGAAETAAPSRSPVSPKPALPAVSSPERVPAPSAAGADDGARAIALLEGRKPQVSANDSFVVQIGAFSVASKANAIGSDLKKRGFSAYTEKAGTVTRVRVGPFASREDAEKVAERLHASGMKGVVVPR